MQPGRKDVTVTLSQTTRRELAKRPTTAWIAREDMGRRRTSQTIGPCNSSIKTLKRKREVQRGTRFF